MKYLFITLFSVVSFATTDLPLAHWDLEMTGGEYQPLMRSHSRDDGEENNELEPIMVMGKKFFAWMKLINENRPEGNKISLSSAQNQPGYPIDRPRVSSPKIILDLFEKLQIELPQNIKGIILGSVAPTQNPPISDSEFISWGIKIDEIYARASRWILQSPMLWGYAARKHDDIRGYYYLQQVPQLEETLINWKTLSEETRKQYEGWLQGLCFNGGDTESICSDNLNAVIEKEGHPLTFYRTFLKEGQAKWDELFLITAKRDDIVWESNSSHLLKTPFTNPKSLEVFNFLKVNIEEEWRWGNWALNLDFIEGGYETTHIVFSPGATPHVNSLAGSTITMDANQSLAEYHVRWTIRHEFGHTLGFPDCYVEFYDTSTQEMISYQVDTSNLMCSRRGKLQGKHYNELKRVYYTP